MNQIDFLNCSFEFEFDGSWNDLYVLNASRGDWNKLVKSLWEYPQEWFDGNGKGDVPENLDQAFSGENRGVLIIDANGVKLNAHFFTEYEIEFDFDPRAVTEQRTFDTVCEFMKVVGDSVGKPVIMTPENSKEHVFFRYDPLTDTIHQCTSDWAS